MDKDATTRLRAIPGVGPSLAADLVSLGYGSVAELRGEDPEAMYARLMEQVGTHVDRCVLYVFRCAVYFAETDRPDPEKLKWWSWKG
ncbi:helix-hairpin-helix domain-containing protein [Pseudodesulfovibrio sp.]|uniref:helix-hairpin-helix domain-containing protein n=1 Tax=Pseudodesulfovibrio sp. TaxID=2035812 RepID=UPI00262A77DF|nr:helix-hairpin-helix domain-containing protein [Pseudodesulfovibrio sp.]MDD3311718.1 helix-hairpin-helix domain-containing protein [Pseudodesulfovibrio sp.]